MNQQRDFGEHTSDAAVASTGGNSFLELVFSERRSVNGISKRRVCTRHLLVRFGDGLRLGLKLHLQILGLWLGPNSFGGAVGDLSVRDEALNEPVAFTRAVLTRSHTALAEVVVAIVADAAVKVLVDDGAIAHIAVDRPRRRGDRRAVLLVRGEHRGPRRHDVVQLGEEAGDSLFFVKCGLGHLRFRTKLLGLSYQVVGIADPLTAVSFERFKMSKQLALEAVDSCSPISGDLVGLPLLKLT